MDSMDQEKERGITISSKITGMMWKGTQLNIVDTPGHADFGGEVERVLSLVDGVVIVVDASDGPNTQTRYVTSKALERGLQPLIVVNKVDRDTADITKTENEVFDLFIALNANDEQLEAPFVYASARSGWAVDPQAEDYEEIEVGKDIKNGSMAPLLDAIVTHLPEPSSVTTQENKIKATCRFLVSMMSHDKYLGRLVTGKIEGHGVKLGDEIRVLKRDGTLSLRVYFLSLSLSLSLSLLHTHTHTQ
jgi:GTP-binding protein